MLDKLEKERSKIVMKVIIICSVIFIAVLICLCYLVNLIIINILYLLIVPIFLIFIFCVSFTIIKDNILDNKKLFSKKVKLLLKDKIAKAMDIECWEVSTSANNELLMNMLSNIQIFEQAFITTDEYFCGKCRNIKYQVWDAGIIPPKKHKMEKSFIAICFDNSKTVKSLTTIKSKNLDKNEIRDLIFWVFVCILMLLFGIFCKFMFFTIMAPLAMFSLIFDFIKKKYQIINLEAVMH